MRKIECFKIRILESETKHIFDLDFSKSIKDILCDQFSLSLNPVTIVADPFLFIYNNTLFLFYELKRNYSPGIICMTSTSDFVHWTQPFIVLEEKFHLSYPFVFEDSGSIYMIPETSDVGDIRLYKADNINLNHFSFYKTILKKKVVESEIGYADSSIYKKDGLYYLVTSIERNRNNKLYLYTSDTLLGPYKVHPCSPICSSSKYGRNGGSFVEDNNGNLYRVAQDCGNRYGENIHVFQIDLISSLKYEEHLVISNLIPQDITFYHEGGHQFNMVNFMDRVVIATDAKEYHSYTLSRLIHKSGLFVHSFFRKILPTKS